VDQDFTADKNALVNEVGVYNGTEGAGFAQGATANSNQVERHHGYTPDESEYNDLNTDRELFALRAIAKSLEKITRRSSLLYFSGGISRDGIEIRPRCGRRSMRRCVQIWPSTAWIRAGLRRLGRWAMRRREACAVALQTAVRCRTT